MRKAFRNLFISIAMILVILPVTLSDISLKKNYSTLAIPCNSEKEKCTAFFHSMLKYLRTFTLKYKIYKVTQKDKIKTIFIKFIEGDQCRKILTREYNDLKDLDVKLEKKFMDDKEYWLLFNLNHRLIMACIG